MNNNWEVKKLGEICSFENGDRGTNYPSKSARTSEGIAFINAGHLTENGIDLENMDFISRERFNLLSNGKVRKGDILFCLRGSLGKFSSVDNLDEGAIASSLVIVRPSDKILNKYLQAYFSSQLCSEMISFFGNGAAQPNLSAASLRQFTIPLPSLAEQQRIVAILDEAFAAIGRAKENAEKNLQNARELFDSYLHSVFANPGDGWEETKLGNLCDFVRGPFGGSLTKSIFKPDGFAVYEQQHAIYNQFDKIRYFIDDKKFNEMKRFELNSGDLIMSCSGTMGKVAIVPDNVKKGIINQALLKLSPSKKLINTFLKLWMESENFQDALKAYSQGAAIQNVASVKILKDIEMPVPSIEEQQTIINKLDALLAETKKLEIIYRQKINDLDELKKSILQKAFAGELTAKRQVNKPIDIHAGIIAYAYQQHYRKGRIGTFGRVKTEKIVHLTQSSLNIELDRNPIKDGHGPNDFQRLHEVETRAKEENYFETERQNYGGYKYIPGNQFNNLIEKTKDVLSDKINDLTELIDLFIKEDTQFTEIVATVYAAWNNLLIDNLPITDEAIVTEARENWHEEKLKIERDKFFNAIFWMKRNKLIPKGTGKKVLAKK